MNRILITGTNSFVGGSYMRFSKFKELHEVSLFDIKPEDIDFSNTDVVLHLVAIVHQTRTISEEEYFKINHDLCIKVAEHAKESGVKQFVFLSTVKVYGNFKPGSSPWNEQSVCCPEDAYGKSKFEAEKSLRKLEDANFTISIIRTPLVYGEGVRANMLKMIKLVRYVPVLPFKELSNRRCYTSSRNLVAFIDRIIEKKSSGVFIAMDKEAISTTELVKLISEELGKKTILVRMPDILTKIGFLVFPKLFDRLFGSYEMDNSETLKVLEFEPPFTASEGIKKMMESFTTE